MSKKHGHHGGAWKVAYADFVTAMMALFMVLWLTAQDAKIKDAVERAFTNPFSAVNKESTGIIPNEEKDANSKASGNFQSVNAVEMEMLRHISEDLAKMLQQTEEMEQTISMELTPEGLRINVFDRTLKPIFDANTDAFTKYGDWVFSTLAWEISRYTTFRIELDGHTEAINQTGREAHSKWELSSERANAARRKLLLSGVEAAQIIKVAGYADTVPLAGKQPSDESNRRVSVLLKVSEPK